MIKKEELKNSTVNEIIDEYPYTESFFDGQKLAVDDGDKSLREIFADLTVEEMEDVVFDVDQFADSLASHIRNMQEFLGENDSVVGTLSILAGKDKDGELENYDKLDIKSGEIISIVGPTGSGKSRLLADIEWTAQGDTPTERQILINDEVPDKKWRFTGGKKLVAQLSQNMNFVMDLSVIEFLNLHAESRLIDNQEEVVERIFAEANQLAGEQFSRDAQITSLSGGQSRALMIADTAILSSSPIILIDEIENAGINREKALELLVGEEKVVLMATHDPILALMGDKRIIINNGGIKDIIKTTAEEKELMQELKVLDKVMTDLREDLRYGKNLSRINDELAAVKNA
ncbi:ABC-type lipoprotein export system, ATPase component [Halanaerobium congolense]|jgi:ABC-type lipoprotein export system ATPase subunit|uniref:ABC-type lipoprotein export system, ATPase component n=1 Tax=Halanaerobium congolense TaxID=54121 RepID=A0A1H9Y5V0_9FIRM|nr:ATP-binding cassette domain-containing protein [Halanaerobium congolense]PTX16686.1 ABC-type lipoprotein export system ATPase subunit [Halanaerobium congolense]SDE83406.1 ABC-type lipoprotein export system, ATPase component [Halanaerobium congolense]SDH67991.1 ABC-type lipoprotein export system, ATPase component [Halanaerobium congolense]SES64260.1 ABC-type lipoprotein export system, ATPase component [Halanaerobium congolense]SFO91325.1 ABC-type lipoprotein export system, ATPase component [